MLIDYLTTKYHHRIEEGWGALEIGNQDHAEKHFKEVLAHEDDPKMHIRDRVEAHAGVGAVALAHHDFFEAARWYAEAKHLLDRAYHTEWPAHLRWDHPFDRPAMRTLIGLAHIAYRRNEPKNAKKYYRLLLEKDPSDELGVKDFLTALQHGRPFPE